MKDACAEGVDCWRRPLIIDRTARIEKGDVDAMIEDFFVPLCIYRNWHCSSDLLVYHEYTHTGAAMIA